MQVQKKEDWRVWYDPIIEKDNAEEAAEAKEEQKARVEGERKEEEKLAAGEAMLQAQRRATAARVAEVRRLAAAVAAQKEEDERMAAVAAARKAARQEARPRQRSLSPAWGHNPPNFGPSSSVQQPGLALSKPAMKEKKKASAVAHLMPFAAISHVGKGMKGKINAAKEEEWLRMEGRNMAHLAKPVEYWASR